MTNARFRSKFDKLSQRYLLPRNVQGEMVRIEVKLTNEILALTLADAMDMINTRPLKSLS